MTARHRTRETKFRNGGTWQNSKYAFLHGTGQSAYSRRDDMYDAVDAPPYPDHNLDHVTQDVERCLTVNGYVNNDPSYAYGGPARTEYSDYRPNTKWSYATSPDGQNMSYWQTKALANLNPYRPKWNLPLFLFELKDFPHMLRELGGVLKGRLKPDSVPGGYLSYQFGWAPLVSDLMSLFDLTADIDNRMRYFRNLQKGKKISRVIATSSDRTLGEPVNHVACFEADDTFAYGWTTQAYTKETMRVWLDAHASFKGVLPNSDVELRSLSRNAILGLHSVPWTVWDAIPWSWLIDYFVNVGDFLEATQGWLNLDVTRLNVMAKTQRRTRFIVLREVSTLSVSGALWVSTRRQRLASVDPTPSLSPTPFLSGKQMSILGALVTATALRKAR